MKGEGRTFSDVRLATIELMEAPSADATDPAAEARDVAVSIITATLEVTEARTAAVSRCHGWYWSRLELSRRADMLT